MAENQSKKQDKQYQISMMVTDEVIRDFGIRQEDVTWRRIGNRKCRVVMVDASEEEHKAYMAPIWAEIKREDRDGRCMVKGKNDRLIRCPESNRCEETSLTVKKQAVLIITIGTAFFSPSCKTWFHSRLPGDSAP